MGTREAGGGAARARAAGASEHAASHTSGDATWSYGATGSPNDAQSDAVRAYLASSDVHFRLQDDADCPENELEEFYSYVEVPLFLENRESWMEWCARHWRAIVPDTYAFGAWTTLPERVRRQLVQRLLSALDLHDPAARLCASRALLYHLLGSFEEAPSDADQMHWVHANAQCILDLGGVDDIFVALKRACWKHNWFSALPDYLPHEQAGQEPLLTPETKAEYLEEINVEITVHFAQLYAVLEALRGDHALSEALMVLDPPLPVFLFQLVANLREKSIKGFPVKKLVLLLWKSLLATLGGNEAIEQAKTRTRYKEGLGPRLKSTMRSPTSPADIRRFRDELAAKYPTLLHTNAMEQLRGAEELAMATQPLPARHAQEEVPETPETPAQAASESRTGNALPPPTGKQGKQKFQTDQSRPFVLPYASQMNENELLLGSVQEALDLYRGHLYIDTGVWQMCQVREQLLSERQGDLARPRDHEAAVHDLQRSFAALQLPSMPTNEDESSLDDERLAWVDQIYGAILPELQSAVIVLLKLMLATTTSGGTNSAYSRAVADGIPSEKAPEPTLEDMDIVRHREILNKGISSLLLLTLRWFKASHVLKFEYLSQIMLDSNVLLLILKIFGLQEVGHFVRWRCEVEPFGLLSYCRRIHGQATPTTPHDLLASTKLRIGDVWDEFPDDPWRLSHATSHSSDATPSASSQAFSWRNFATAAHLTRILHKICKNKVHRILLLVQYKSAAILKRTLRVQHTALQQYVLKLIKSQVPFCGRKWRQSNMRIITLIYLLCKPALRDDWLGGSDIDAEVEASLPEEQTLRALIQYYNRSQFAARAAVAGAEEAADNLWSSSNELANGSEPAVDSHEAASSAFEREAFPLRHRPMAAGTPGRYISDDAVEGYLDVYEDVLHEMFGAEARPLDALSPATEPETEPETPASMPGTPEQHATEPTVSVEGRDENRNEWEHMSPREMQFLASSPGPKSASPQGVRMSRQMSLSPNHESSISRRVNSSPAQLRPVLRWNMDDLVEDALSIEQNGEQGEGAKLDREPTPSSPLPIPEAPLPSPQPGGIDEVEHIFGA